jgi:hypothetical protein
MAEISFETHDTHQKGHDIQRIDLSDNALSDGGTNWGGLNDLYEALEGWLVPRKHAPDPGEMQPGDTVFIIPRAPAAHDDEEAEEVEDLLGWNVLNRETRGQLATRVSSILLTVFVYRVDFRKHSHSAIEHMQPPLFSQNDSHSHFCCAFFRICFDFSSTRLTHPVYDRLGSIP